MVVGVKVFHGGAVSRTERGTGSSHELAASVEGALLPVGLPVGGAVGAGMHRTTERSTVYEATLEGDRVFAVEYRIVSRKLLRRYRGGSGLRLGNIQYTDYGQGTMRPESDGSDSEESADDDDDEGEGEEEGDVLPLMTSTKDGDVLFLA
ncbi:uncharacterized protein B0I36DRAFT_331331 [Microdochium trichocladiopsis]|uniref:Uncharacterized protein n=1 Tax=Microdochium trichocladiopsis TaxID=1682393 RepID=A0A9P8Y045_9PEZI|nr:uncharacterized protein B0I36DRAFT_331331 [Microdochium trichocladiopsis]KAH7024382.1 hypothetical protein B0I36DRAFT_331331 [Microdochium trichocladiopsis]